MMTKTLTLLAASLLLAACGGGGSSSSSNEPVAQPDTSIIAGTTARFAATTLNFGLTDVGASKSLTVVLHNDGTSEADFSLMDGLPAGFRTSGCESVPAGGSCELRVTFRPYAGKHYAAQGIAPVRAENLANRLTVSGRGVDACGVIPLGTAQEQQPSRPVLCP